MLELHVIFGFLKRSDLHNQQNKTHEHTKIKYQPFSSDKD